MATMTLVSILRSIALGGLVVLAGCAGGGVSNVRTASFPNGVYEFQERGDQAAETFTGKVQILQDSMTVVESTPFCLQKPRASTMEAFVFACGAYGLTGYYRSGQWTMRYSGYRTEAVHSDNCIEYRKTSGGQVCVKRQADRADRAVPFGGVLHLRPAETPSPAPRTP